jgi:hypothetical protein
MPCFERQCKRRMADTRDELQRALGKLLATIEDGLDHGFFEIGIAGELMKDRKRRLTIRAGKTFRFVIPEEDLRPSRFAAISVTETLNRDHEVTSSIGVTPMSKAQRAASADGVTTSTDDRDRT